MINRPIHGGYPDVAKGKATLRAVPPAKENPMPDAPAAPTLGERIKDALWQVDNLGEHRAEAFTFLSDWPSYVPALSALIESQSAEIESLRELRKVAARNAGAADRARFDAERKLAAATEALRACVSVLTDKVVGTVYGDDPNWYRALDDAVALALPLLDAQPEQEKQS